MKFYDKNGSVPEELNQRLATASEPRNVILKKTFDFYCGSDLARTPASRHKFFHFPAREKVMKDMINSRMKEEKDQEEAYRLALLMRREEERSSLMQKTIKRQQLEATIGTMYIRQLQEEAAQATENSKGIKDLKTGAYFEDEQELQNQMEAMDELNAFDERLRGDDSDSD